MKKIKILQVVGQLTIGGQEKMALNFFKYLNREKFQVDYLVYGNDIGVLEKEVISLGGNVFHISSYKEIGMKKYRKELINVLISNGPYQAIHSHTYLNSGIILEVAKKLNIPVRICHCHTTQSGKKENTIYSIYRKLMIKKIKKNGNAFIACGIDAGNSFYGIPFFRKNGVIIKNGINLIEYSFDKNKRKEVRKKLNINENILLLGNVSRLSEVKNHKYIIKIASKLLHLNIPFKVVFVGDGELEDQLKELCKLHNLENYFLFLGNRNDVPDLLQAIDIILHPSLYEGLPLSLIEAQAVKLPCIISNNVTKEIKMTKNISFCGIEDENINDWIEEIIKYKNLDRNEDISELRKRGYDIVDSCNKLSLIYENKQI